MMMVSSSETSSNALTMYSSGSCWCGGYPPPGMLAPGDRRWASVLRGLPWAVVAARDDETSVGL